MFKNVYPREKYLSKIRPFYYSDIIKVITGIRSVREIVYFESYYEWNVFRSIPKTQVIYIPLDRRGYKHIKTAEELEEKIESMLGDEENYYLFIDEVQNVFGFESVIHAYAEVKGYSIFLTGSNSYLLSDEISTKLTGRYLNFETFTLDFSEYLDMKQFFEKGINQDMYLEFEEYILDGGFPKSLEFNDVHTRQTYTRGIISEIFEKRCKNKEENF